MYICDMSSMYNVLYVHRLTEEKKEVESEIQRQPKVEVCHAKFVPPQNGPPWNQNSNQIGSPRNQFGCCNWPPLTVLVPPSLNYSTCMYMTV